MQQTLQFEAPGLQGRFENYDRDNPLVYTEFKRAASQLRNAGIGHYGAKAIFEGLRFRSAVRGRGDQYKVNNNFTSRYARKLIEEDPTFKSFFEIRELKA